MVSSEVMKYLMLVALVGCASSRATMPEAESPPVTAVVTQSTAQPRPEPVVVNEPGMDGRTGLRTECPGCDERRARVETLKQELDEETARREKYIEEKCKAAGSRTVRVRQDGSRRQLGPQRTVLNCEGKIVEYPYSNKEIEIQGRLVSHQRWIKKNCDNAGTPIEGSEIRCK